MKVKKMKVLFMAIALAAGVFAFNAGDVNAAEKSTINSQDNIASGIIDEEYGQIEWWINKDGKLTVEGIGDVKESGSNTSVPWTDWRFAVLSAEINVTNMTDTSRLFGDHSNMKSVNLENLDTSKVTNMSGMFEDCCNLTEIDLSNFNTNMVTDMSHMFLGCENIEFLNLSSFDTKKVVNMEFMFLRCEKLKNIDISTFDTSQVTNIFGMFCRCSQLSKLDLSHFNTSNVEIMSNMFSECYNLIELDISSFNTNNVKDFYSVFRNCPNLKLIKIPYTCKTKIELPYTFGAPWKCPDGIVVDCLPEGEYKITRGEMSIDYDVANVFSDVYDEWYTEYVQYVYDNGLMTGIGGTKMFQPNEAITKAQVAQILYNLDGRPEVDDFTVFKKLYDVSVSDWYADAVAWAYSASIITGDPNTMKFYPNENITREQFALMVYRYASYKKMSTSTYYEFPDMKNVDKVSNWAIDGVKWSVGNGLITGIEKNGVKDLDPHGTATRAQASTIIVRFLSQ